MLNSIYFYLYLILLFKGYLFWVNDPYKNQFCFLISERAEFVDSNDCYEKGGYVINAKTENG